MAAFVAAAGAWSNNAVSSSQSTFVVIVPGTPGRGRAEAARSSCRLSAVKTDEELLPAIRTAVAEAGGKDAWNESSQHLSEFTSGKISIEQAEVCLSKAYKWRAFAVVKSALARKYIETEVPNVSKLQESLSWLTTEPLSLDEDRLCAAIIEHPEAYLLQPQETYQTALACAPAKYKDPVDFKARLLEDASVLTCTYNCADDGCASECGNCWVSYEMR